MERKRLRTVGVLALAWALLGIPTPAAEANADVGDGLRCSVQWRDNQFSLEWSGIGSAPDRYVVERMAFGTVHWRGRTSGSDDGFLDGAAPLGSASMTYWVKALAPEGNIMERAECSWAGGLRCWSSAADGAGVEVRWDELRVTGDTEVVIRRQVKQGQSPWWRAKVQSPDKVGTYYDSAPPTGWARYQVVTQRRNRLIDVSDCAPPRCLVVARTGPPSIEQISPKVPRVEGQAVVLPNDSELVVDSQGFVGPDGGLWFIGHIQWWNPLIVRQDQSSGLLTFLPGPGIESEPGIGATPSRVLVASQGKGSYGSLSEAKFDSRTGQISLEPLAKGTLFTEASDGAMIVEGQIHNASGLQYVAAGASEGVWLEDANGDGTISMRDVTFGTDNRIFYTRSGEWFVADMSCYA